MSRPALMTRKRGVWPLMDGLPITQHHLLSAGLSVKALQGAIEWFSRTPNHVILEAVGIFPGTLSRNQPNDLLPLHLSNSLFALGCLVNLSERVLGSKESAESWLTTTNIGLLGMRPLDLIGTYPGFQSVKELLERIEYGVCA